MRPTGRVVVPAIIVFVLIAILCRRHKSCDESRWNHDFNVYINGSWQLVNGRKISIDPKTLPAYIIKYFNGPSSGKVDLNQIVTVNIVSENPVTHNYRIGDCELNIQRPYTVVKQVEFSNPPRLAAIFRRERLFFEGYIYKAYVVSKNDPSSCFRVIDPPLFMVYDIAISADSSKVVFFEDGSQTDFENASAVLADESGSCWIYERGWDWIYVDPISKRG